MSGFVGLFDTARDYTLQFTITHTNVHCNVFTSRCSVAAFNDGRFASRAIAGVSYQLLTATANND
jgi:hypothetical protein